MLKGKLLQPEILQALGSAGHGAKILISDGNYPHSTGVPETARKVFLNLMPGVTTVPQVLEALVSAIPIEAAEVMVPDNQPHPPVFIEFEKLLPKDVKLTEHKRFEFYEEARKRDTILLIATGEQRVYANLLLTIGVIRPPS